MSRIMAISTPKHKPHRRTPRPATPFGLGLIDPDDDGPDDATLELWAYEAELEDRYMAAIEGLERCAGCGLPDAFIRESDRLCPPCAIEWDREHSICGNCGEPCERLIGSLCDQCDDAASACEVAALNHAAGLGRRVY